MCGSSVLGSLFPLEFSEIELAGQTALHDQQAQEPYD